MRGKNPQTTSTIMMVRPHRFVFNEETSLSNAFQRRNQARAEEEQVQKATAEFDAFVGVLRENGVEVIVKQDTPAPPKPDAIFPNNWVMFHHSGDVSLFPMEAKNRRNERRMDLIDDLKKQFKLQDLHDFSRSEEDGKYLEGTGSMIIDHPNRIAYACISTRTDAGLFSDFCAKMDYEPQGFHAVDENGKPIYHTNVIMSLGSKTAVLCTDFIRDRREKARILDRLEETGHQVVKITPEQVRGFAGNMLQVRNSKGEELMVMSTRAYESLTEEQVQMIESNARIVHSPLTTIEDVGGGSARCMIAEIFAPKPS